jgi:hypothetical protein
MGPLRVPTPKGRRWLRTRGVAVHDRSRRTIEPVRLPDAPAARAALSLGDER